MTINEAQDEIISEFEFLDDWLDKYQEIIDKGMNAKIDPKYKTPEYLIEGCQSKVWIHAEYKDGKVVCSVIGGGEAIGLCGSGLIDAMAVMLTVGAVDETGRMYDIAGGIAVMLVSVLSGHTPDEIIDSELYFIDKIGLKEHLSPTRSNGMLSMLKQMKLYAMAFKSKSES